jgi:hypothetical protein
MQAELLAGLLNTWHTSHVRYDRRCACAPLATASRTVTTADPKVKKLLSNLGRTPFAGSPGHFGKFMADEIEK